MECEYTSELLKLILFPCGLGLVVGGILGFLVFFTRAGESRIGSDKSDEINVGPGGMSLPTRGSHATNPFAEQDTGPELDDMERPMTDDRTPSGFWKIEAYTNGYQIIALGDPPQEDEKPDPPYHNCDEMGCGSLDHVVARVPVMYPTPELAWSGDGRKMGQ